MLGAFLLVAGLGALAGLVAGFVSGGLSMPGTVSKDDRTVWDPGFIGAIVAGAAAAALLFALYGPLKTSVVIRVDDGEAADQAQESGGTVNVTVYDIVAAAMSGLAGSRILTNEVEKKYLRAAAETALARDPAAPGNTAKATTIRNGRPVEVFKAV